MAEQIELVVPADLDGERLDKALSSLLKVSRSAARQLTDKGVLLDGETARASDRVTRGMIVITRTPEVIATLEPEPVGFGVVYEDEALIVVDKPPGLVVHPGTGQTRGTLAAGLLHRYPELGGVGPEGRAGLVHRLDKDTSGVLVVARTPESYSRLVEMMRHRAITRVYTGLAHGVLGSSTGTIDAPIGRDPTQPTRRAVTHDGKHARTHYEVLSRFTPRDVTLLRIRLETGRTHQIRVHLAAIGHPLVGDRVYGLGASRAGTPRVFLHASELGLAHPVTGSHLTPTSPLPPDLADVLTGLGSPDANRGSDRIPSGA